MREGERHAEVALEPRWRAINSSGGLVWVRTKGVVEAGTSTAWAAVADEGPGSEKADRERVFDRFYRGNGSSGDDAVLDGSGLGLAIARQIAESHEGRLVLVSRGPAGRPFVLWLPDHAMNRSAGRTDAPPDGDPLLG